MSNERIQIIANQSNFEREKLKIPFGFKGGYLSELWQTVVQLKSDAGHNGIGLGTQSVLYGDADLFAKWSEAEGNALMYTLTERALQLAESVSFRSPVSLMEKLLPDVREEARRITGKKDINENFIQNALVSLDNAAWLLYARENNYATFSSMIPEPFQTSLSHRNEKIGVMFQVSYGMALDAIEEAVDQGYFIIKIKIGQSGSQEQMLRKDMNRLTEIHNLLKNKSTTQTPENKILYTLDANGRYKKRETLQRLVQYADKTGALEHILFIEEPLSEENNQDVSGFDVPIAADDSVHNVEDAKKRIDQGYRVLVLKGVAKTLSISLKIAKLADEQDVPCVCSDLTVNPILVDWHKLLASHIQPFPGLGMGLMETNGDMNYQNWEEMRKYHPKGFTSWTSVSEGVFHLDEEFYRQSGGIFDTSSHYKQLVIPE